MNINKVNRKFIGWHNKSEQPILDKHILIEPSDEFKKDNDFAYRYEELNNIYFIGKRIKFILDSEEWLIIYNTDGIMLSDIKCNWDIFVKRWIYLDDIKVLFE